MKLPIAIPADAVAEFCRRNQIRRLSLFGSVLRSDFGPRSDVDVLIEFEKGHRVGLVGLARMQRELGSLIGRTVDLRTPNDLSPRFREEVLKAALPQYAA